MKYIIRKRSPQPGGHNEYWSETGGRGWTRVKGLAVRFDTERKAESKAVEITVELPKYIGRLSVDPVAKQ